MKIKSLTVDNFRGFPQKETIYLDGKNLLVYGENGAGKSSLFYALRDYFTSFAPFSSAPRRLLTAHKNLFQAERDCTVSVAFDDSIGDATWSKDGHPSQNQFGGVFSKRVFEASLARACLDYRSLLDTNYRHGNGEPNLFDIAIRQLLTGHSVTIDGKWTTIGALWNIVNGCKPAKLLQNKTDRAARRGLEEIDEACAQFNKEFSGAIDDVRIKATELLQLFGQGGVAIQSFRFANVKYNAHWNKKERRFIGTELGVNLTFHGERIERAQNFLNEARLSALALAIYLAGRLVSVPSDEAYKDRGDTPPFRLLVLDDVLVGIDHSNRLPLLRVLESHFRDWQIVLLTHDRVWFEMARFEIKKTEAWKCLEIYEGTAPEVDANNNVVVDDDGKPVLIPAPTVHPDHYTDLSLPKSLLAQASRFLEQGFLPAAANYTRAAYEASLKTVCHEFGIPVPYNVDSRKIGSDVFHQAVITWLETKPHERKQALLDAMTGVGFYRTIVLNPLSHSLPWKLTKEELAGAMRAVERLQALRRATEDLNPERLRQARDIINKVAPTEEELQLGLTKLQSAFQNRLDSFCEGRVNVRYSRKSPSKKTLWQALVQSKPQNPPSLVALLADATKVQLIENWLVNDPKNEALTREVLRQLLNIISPTGGEKLIFDKE